MGELNRGERLQIMLSLDAVGEEALAAFKRDIDLGDHLFAKGHVGKSRRGEVSVFASEWALAAKAIRPLPVLHKDLSEESRVRHRYVDLIARPLARDTVRRRAHVVRSLRESVVPPHADRGVINSRKFSFDFVAVDVGDDDALTRPSVLREHVE